jgi:hypothetical protein
VSIFDVGSNSCVIRSVKAMLDPRFDIGRVGRVSIFDVGSNFCVIRSVKAILDPRFDIGRVGHVSIFDVGSNSCVIRSVEAILDPRFDIGRAAGETIRSGNRCCRRPGMKRYWQYIGKQRRRLTGNLHWSRCEY